MVIHDRAQTEQWAQMKMEQEQQRPVKEPKQRHHSIWSVVAVQSLACIALLLFALLFRLVGGDTYEDLRNGFHEALEKNELITALSRLWDEDPFEDFVPTEEGGVKQEGFTE